MLHKIGQALSGIMLTVLIIACLLLVAPRVFGIQLFSVLSGSMEPAFHVNDLVYAFPSSYEEIETGDPITFRLNENTIVTHRVVKKDDAKQSLYTKGDANETADGTPTAYSDVIGVVRFYIPMVGGVLQSISSGSGRIIALTVAAVVILLTLLLTINGQPDKEDQSREAQIGAYVQHPQQGNPARRNGRGAAVTDDWEMADEPYGRKPVQNRRQSRSMQLFEDESDPQTISRKPANNPRRMQVTRPGHYRPTYADEDDWAGMEQQAGRYAADRRENVSSIQRTTRSHYQGDGPHDGYAAYYAKEKSRMNRADVAPDKQSAKQNKQRRAEVPQQPAKHKRTGRQTKAQLPPAWR